MNVSTATTAYTHVVSYITDKLILSLARLGGFEGERKEF